MHNGILDSMPGPGGQAFFNNNRRYNNNNYNNNNFNNNYNNNAPYNNRMNSFNNSSFSGPTAAGFYQDWSKPMPPDENLEK